MISGLIGLSIGLILGLTGAGGSIFAVPLLILFLHYSPEEAIGMSLGIVMMNAIFGVFLQFKSGNIKWIPALVFLSVGSLVAPFGTYIRTFIDDTFLMLGFNILVVIVAYKLWMQSVKKPEDAKIVRANYYQNSIESPQFCHIINNKLQLKFPCIRSMIFFAILTGILSGLFGVGGGFIIVPALILLTGMPMYQAVPTSLLVISAVSASGFMSYVYQGGVINWTEGGIIVLFGILGMTVSRFISNKIKATTLQKTFSVFMVILSVLAFYFSSISK